MAKSKDILVIPFSLLKRDMFPQYTRDEFRKVIRKAPMLAVGGKLYVKKAPYSDLVVKLAGAMTEMSTDALRFKLESLKQKYPKIDSVEKIPRSLGAKEKMEALCIFLIPVELDRRLQLLENLSN